MQSYDNYSSLVKTMNANAKVFCCALILSLMVLAGCAKKVAVNDIWIDETYYDRQYESVLVIGLAEKITFRNLFEGNLVNQLRRAGVEAFPSYEILPYTNMLNREAVLTAVAKYGIDSVLVTSLVGTDIKTIYYSDQNASYSNPYSYSRFINDAVNRSDSTASYDVGILFLKTNLYDVNSEKLVWSLTSETEFTYRANSLNDAVKLVIDMLRNDGLI